VARALGIPRIIFPPSAGVASAFGLLTAPPAFDFTRSLPSALDDVSWKEVGRALDEMREEGARQLRRSGVADGEVRLEVAVDARHKGQGESLTVPLGEALRQDPRRQLDAAFEEAYVHLYGRRPPGVETEVLTWRLRVLGPAPALRPGVPGGAGGARKARRPIWAGERGAFMDADVIDRYRLSAGEVVVGPAVIEERESTAIVGPGGRAELDPAGNLVVTIDD
jgi:N-methylhydantoinase A